MLKQQGKKEQDKQAAMGVPEAMGKLLAGSSPDNAAGAAKAKPPSPLDNALGTSVAGNKNADAAKK